MGPIPSPDGSRILWVGGRRGRTCLCEFIKQLKSYLQKAPKLHNKLFPLKYKHLASPSSPNSKKVKIFPRKCRSKLWILHKEPGATQVLVQRPQVAPSLVGGSPLALLAAPILLTLVQEEELV